MLYDPRWEQNIKAKPSLAGFVSWLETMPARRTYVWSDCSGKCAVDQYFSTFNPTYSEREQLWQTSSAKLNRLAMDGPRNFGALLKRARAAAER